MPISDLLSATGALALVIGLIVLLRFGARFVAPKPRSAGAPDLLLRGQIGLDGKRRLHLLRCAGSQVLVLTGGAGDVMVVLPPPSAEPTR